jgi:SAM-dependent methyltransferase
VPTESLTPDYFDRLYAEKPDPWSFATSGYELRKYDDTLAALGPHYAKALEIGCSVGVLTARLAPRCADLLAVDVSDRALATARQRCAAFPQVRFERASLPAEFPAETFDLVLVSEVAYYWSDGDFSLARDAIAAALPSGGDLLLVHFLPHVDDYVRDGDAVHEVFLADARFTPVHGHRADRYRLDLLRRR